MVLDQEKVLMGDKRGMSEQHWMVEKDIYLQSYYLELYERLQEDHIDVVLVHDYHQHVYQYILSWLLLWAYPHKPALGP